MASKDVASNVCQALLLRDVHEILHEVLLLLHVESHSYIALPSSIRFLYTRFLSYMASYDVVNNIC